jgi:hypothetical protein
VRAAEQPVSRHHQTRDVAAMTVERVNTG